MGAVAVVMSPQQYTSRWVDTAHVAEPAAEIWANVTPAGMVTGAGSECEPRVPSPSWLLLLRPQHQAVPAADSTHACAVPRPIDVSGIGLSLREPDGPVSFPHAMAAAHVRVKASVRRNARLVSSGRMRHRGRRKAESMEQPHPADH